MLGVVEALTGGFAGELLAYAVAIVATLVLSQAANAGMVGIARTAYTLAMHRQIPRGVARLHPRYGTPWIVISIFTVLAFALVLPLDIELLAGMFAYGALIAFALAHLSVCVLRFKEPSRPRAYKVPLNVRMRGGELPLPAAFGAVLSIAAWVATFFYHDDARVFGSAWMAFGLLLYVAYRSREGLSLTRMVEVPAERMSHEPEVEYARILVPVFGEAARRRHHEHRRPARQRARPRRGDDRRDLRARGADVAAARRPAAGGEARARRGGAPAGEAGGRGVRGRAGEHWSRCAGARSGRRSSRRPARAASR